jgi:hypothetical protein
MKSTMFTLLMLFTLSALAQFGYKSKKELEAVKNTELTCCAHRMIQPTNTIKVSGT